MTQTPAWYPPHPQGQAPGQQHSMQGMNHQGEYHGGAPTGTGGMGHQAHASFHAHQMSANGGQPSMRSSAQMMHQHGQVPNARMNFHPNQMPQSSHGQPMSRFGAPHGSHMHHHNMSAHNHAAYPPNNSQRPSFPQQPPYSQCQQQQLGYAIPMTQAPSSNRGMPADFASTASMHQPGPSQQHHHYDDSPRSPSPPAIPPPPPPKEFPQSAPSELAHSSVEAKQPRLSEEGPLRESRRQNSLAASDPNKIATQDVQPKGAQIKGAQTKVPGKKVSVQEASLLLGLTMTNADSKSPDEVPQGTEEVEPQVQNETDHTASEATVSDEAAKQAAVEKPKKSYPTRLAMKADRANLNSLHCFIRSELLEIFVIEPSKTSTNNSMAGRIGMQCVHCALNRHNDPKRVNEATMAVFYPKSISEIYRLVTNFTRCHLTKCRNMPPSVRAHWDSLRAVDKSRGKTQYWTDSAKLLGLVNITDTRAGGVRFQDHVMEPPKQQHEEERDDVATAFVNV